MANIPEEFRLIMERHGEIKEEVHRSVPVFENCVNYRMDEVIALSKLIRGCVEEPSSDKRKEMKTQLALSLDQIRPVREQRKILLWPEGRMPAETDYKDNSDLRYNHDPDFIPYMYEILCDENVTPKGAIVVVAGGDHGECVIAEGYQTCLDFRERGYQCFLLLNRTNHNPWSAKESGVDVEVHTFAGVPHGQAGRKITDGVQYPNFELWIPLADHFMQYAFAKKG